MESRRNNTEEYLVSVVNRVDILYEQTNKQIEEFTESIMEQKNQTISSIDKTMDFLTDFCLRYE